MEPIRTVDLQELRARIARGEYVVDAQAVAGAIVGRALVARRDEQLHHTGVEDDGEQRDSTAA
jgi:hypothetical protein